MVFVYQYRDGLQKESLEYANFIGRAVQRDSLTTADPGSWAPAFAPGAERVSHTRRRQAPPLERASATGREARQGGGDGQVELTHETQI